MRGAVMRARIAVPISLAVPLLLAACRPEPTDTPYTPVADVAELMNAVLDPASDTYWDAVGTIIDFEGIHDFAPQSTEEWDAVRNAAYVLAESGNLLMMDGRAVDHAGWIGFSRAMVRAGEQALEAAVAEDEAAVFDAGAEVYYVCSGCHTAYALDLSRPSDADTSAISDGSAISDSTGG